MNEKRKKVADFLSEYKVIVEKKRIIEEQMFETGGLIRELNREKQSDGGKAQKRANGYLKRLEDAFCSLNAKRGALRMRIKTIESMLECLSPNEKLIIKRYYLEGDYRRANDDLIEILGFEKSHIYRLRDSALDKVALLIDDFEGQVLPEKLWEQTGKDNAE